MLFLTTTAIDLDEELLNRCLVLTINESREQTAAIHARQRQARTLAGLVASTQGAVLRTLHQATQSLLRPLAVVNPYAEQLTFRSESTRMRRDHAKYLTLIDAIALLHQHQRVVRTASVGAAVIEYVEVTRDDIALANRLAHEVLGRSLDELPPQTRRVLGLVVDYVHAQPEQRSLVRFTRRALREATGLGDTQLKLHLARLEDYEYVIAHRMGQQFRYELLYAGDGADPSPQLVGLIDVATLSADTTAKRSGQSDDRSGLEVERSGSGRPVVGVQSAGGRGDRIEENGLEIASSSTLVAAVAETAHLAEKVQRRRSRSGVSSELR